MIASCFVRREIRFIRSAFIAFIDQAGLPLTSRQKWDRYLFMLIRTFQPRGGTKSNAMVAADSDRAHVYRGLVSRSYIWAEPARDDRCQLMAYVDQRK